MMQPGVGLFMPFPRMYYDKGVSAWRVQNYKHAIIALQNASCHCDSVGGWCIAISSQFGGKYAVTLAHCFMVLQREHLSRQITSSKRCYVSKRDTISRITVHTINIHTCRNHLGVYTHKPVGRTLHARVDSSHIGIRYTKA